MNFEWNAEKETLNIKKHGVTFEQACYVFSDQFSLSMYDNQHSDNEDRWITLGQSLNEKLLLVVHTLKYEYEKEELVRIISARKATNAERKAYQTRCLI